MYYRNQTIEIIYLTVEERRRVVPLVENTDLDLVLEFGLEIKEVEGGRQVTLRLSKGEVMLGEILIYKYDGYMQGFQRSELRTRVNNVHEELCWEVHEQHETLTEESVICKCLLGEFLRVGNRRVSLIPIQYVRPDMYIPTMVLLRGVKYFVGKFDSLRWRLRIKFLINLGRKIKNQRHIFMVGDREIPNCFEHHVRTALLTLPFSLNPEVVRQSIASLTGDLLQLVQGDDYHQQSLCWIMKKEIQRTIMKELIIERQKAL